MIKKLTFLFFKLSYICTFINR